MISPPANSIPEIIPEKGTPLLKSGEISDIIRKGREEILSTD